MKPFKFLQTLQMDVKAVLARDPAARNALEVISSYPGLHALWGYRLAHWLWQHRFRLLGRWVSQISRFFTGIEIHPGATIGPGFFIDHGMGVVIGETAEIGRNVTLYHGVTLGGVSLEKGKRHPTLGDNVVVGAGAKVLGNIFIGDNSRIGANAVVVKSVPPNSVVVGVPGEVVVRSKPRPQIPDLEHGRLPDVIGESLASVMRRLDALEHGIQLQAALQPPQPSTGGSASSSHQRTGEREHVHAPSQQGIWRGEDFMI
jgi:serine O-acetyltransferase